MSASSSSRVTWRHRGQSLGLGGGILPLGFLNRGLVVHLGGKIIGVVKER